MAIIVTGGARSGKSSFAEKLAAKLGDSGLYIATAQIYDEEMRERVSSHQSQREEGSFPWTTREEPYALAALLRRLAEHGGVGLGAEAAVPAAPRVSTAADATAASIAVTAPREAVVVLVDCLTLWLSNELLRYAEGSPEVVPAVTAAIADLVAAVAAYPYPLVLVTNEVGDGVVPPSPLGRLFRDLAGRLNQQLAAACSHVFLVTAGIPVELKSIAFDLDNFTPNK
ncbi:bifunctional adenosylcobinamide kinase/adenosylcobinamide-phosphate guanylyltransferase [Paenibacillus sp. N1-5-1-14]|uniref:bifunctional adenosylcobinamide kinase/adenosylcobinamide-phosphate guanylyltransferase n=1 Tax=Paenibacillus radicibacter TaxID=2972488 RepID=UPI002159309D|nr:bifunctional adenosylcobinamide kinase/adenosylcobinamide-phosphate guanylyltransferase [Paenibacillus radicibacter]MCR8644895.1 bifunctional adenosylcobinamide kinase/adenosylcobinamide-phosphate guanylyltransferase [Paenibacillus radicibacter]